MPLETSPLEQDIMVTKIEIYGVSLLGREAWTTQQQLLLVRHSTTPNVIESALPFKKLLQANGASGGVKIQTYIIFNTMFLASM